MLVAAQHRRLGLGRRRVPPAHVRDRDPGDDGHRGRARPARAPGHAGDRRAGGTRRRAATAPRRPDAHRGAPPLPRAGAARAARGLRPVPLRRRPGGAHGRAVGVRLRRVLEEAGGVYVKLGQIAATRVDLIPPEMSDELAKLQNRVPPEPTEAIRRCWKPSSVTASTGVRRVRLGTARSGVDRSDATGRGCESGEAVVVKVQRPGIEDVMERDLAALALVADVAQRRPRSARACDRARCSTSSRRASAPSSTSCVRPTRWREMALLLGTGIGGPDPEGLRRALHASPARAGAFRRLHRGRHPTQLDAAGIDRTALAEQLLRRCSTRCCGSASSTPIRTRATSSCSRTARSGSSTSARWGDSTRSSRRRRRHPRRA